MSSKTVDRWITDPVRVPHPQTREDVAEALGVDADVLWPKIRSAVKTGPDREIVATYPYRNACPAAVWSRLLDDAAREITYAGYTNYFIWQEQPRVGERLAAKVAAGCTVRFLVGDPESEVTRRREEIEAVPLTVSTRIQITLDALSRIEGDGVEARLSDGHIALSVFRFDDEMLVTPHLANLLGHDSPLLHLRRRGEGGLFDRFAEHVEALWTEARPVLATS
ncbi:hypothetical protein [Streptomyces sp. NPDC090994]|uniref:hypothetical protein n=1 Tax=Streptomyces sp. NPDC090994 TaxID=3365969 RepID=UPI003827D308